MKNILIICLCSIGFLNAYSSDPPCIDLHSIKPLYVQNSLYCTNLTANTWTNNTSYMTGIKYGYVAGPVVLGLAIASEITKQNQLPSLPLGVTSAVISMISVPIIATNAKSLSTDWKKVKKAAWFAYGGGMFLSSILITSGIIGVTPPTPVIAVNGIVFASSIVLMTHCTRHSGSATAYREPTVNFGITPVQKGSICTLALRF